MDIRWYGQSAFLLTGEKSVFVDPPKIALLALPA